jgi:hypothetical protein
MAYVIPNSFGWTSRPEPGGTTTSFPWVDVELAGGNLVQDPQTAIDSVSYGATTSVTLKDQDPGNIVGPNPFTPDCPFWAWDIEATFDFVANISVVVEMKLTGAPNLNYQIYLGVYDGTTLSARWQGLYAAITCTNGNTGAGRTGVAVANGDASAGIHASGGILTGTFGFDVANSRCRGVQAQSVSNTGPAYGFKTDDLDPTAWTGSAMKGFLAIGAGGSRAGGTFSGIALRHAMIPSFS